MSLTSLKLKYMMFEYMIHCLYGRMDICIDETENAYLGGRTDDNQS